MRIPSLAIAFLALAAPAMGQPCPGTVTPFGTGGPDCSSTLHKLTVTGCPTPGNTVEIVATIGSWITYPIAVYLGGSDRTWAGVPLPLDLTRFGAPGNHVYVALDVQLAWIRHGGGGGKAPLPIPNDSALKNLSAYLQAVIVGCGANQLRLVFSNGVKMTIG